MAEQVFIVGRASIVSGNDLPIVIDDPNQTESKTHCKILVDRGSLFVEDLGSTNGTYIAGQRISKATKVDPDTELQIGNNVTFKLNNDESIMRALTLLTKSNYYCS